MLSRAYIQGQGWCTTEESLWLRHNGAIATLGPGAYKIPGFGCLPQRFNVSLLRDAAWPNLGSIKASFYLSRTRYTPLTSPCPIKTTGLEGNRGAAILSWIFDRPCDSRGAQIGSRRRGRPRPAGGQATDDERKDSPRMCR